MNKRIGAALIAVLLVLHSLLGFGAGTANAETAAEAQPAQTAQATDNNETPSAATVNSPSSDTDSTQDTPSLENDQEAEATVQQAVYGTPQPSNILTSVSLTDDEGNPVGGDDSSDRIDPGEALNLNYRWELPNDHTYTDGSTFEFDLPSEFRIYTDIRDVPLTTGGDNGESVGAFSVSTDGHVVVTFNRFVEEYSNISGNLTVRSELKEEIVKETNQVRITFPIGDAGQVIVLYLMPKNGVLLDKTGKADDAGGKIDWTVDVNTSLQKLSSVSLSDTIPEGLTLDSASVRVYKLNVSSAGDRTQGEAVAADQYVLEGGQEASELKLAFAAESINEAYRITYSTAIGAGSQAKFTNTATLKASDREDVSASSTVTVKRGELISKSVGAYDQSTQSIDWIIGYNAGALTIPKSQALLKDRFNSGQRLVDESFKVTENATGRVLVAGTDYTVTNVAIANGKAGFDLQFANDVTTAYTITYRTTATGTVYNNDKITNTVTTGTVSKSASKNLERNLLTKTNTGVNYAAKTSSWRTIVNRDSFTMDNAVMTDTFPNGGLELVPGSVKVTDSKGTVLKEKVDYELTVPEGNRSGFTISFKGTLNGERTITYTTNFNQNWKIDRQQTNFVNKAKVTWSENGAPREREVSASFAPGTLTLQNGSKSGSYDPRTKQLTWDVKLNYNKLALDQAVLSDVIQPGQRFVEGSLTVNQMTLVNGKDSVSKGKTLDPSSYTVVYPSDANGNQLQIVFKGTTSDSFWVTFKTTVDGQIVGKSASNEATLTSANTELGSWTASVPIPGGGEYVAKTAAQQGGKIAWSVTVNKGQSYVENAKIIDTPTSNQQLDESSFRLYRAVVAANGTPSKGELLVKDRDYSLTITSGKEERFELAFAQPIREAFILEYTSTIYAADRENVSNKVSFEGTGVTTGQTDTSRSIIVRTSSGSGTGSGVRGALEVTKVDSADETKLLPGATFVLQDVNKRRPAITRTTDDAGRIMFNQLLYGSYTLTETQAPEGYKLPEEASQTVMIDSSVVQTAGVKSVQVKNEALPVTPEQPTTPPEPENPTDPGGPTQPPVDPGTPAVPETPTDPQTPVTPTNPEQPTTPPDNGNTPEQPTVPGTTQPEFPVPDDNTPVGTPEIPSTPGIPVDNGTPSTPENPEVDVPEDDTPQGTPDVPSEPDTNVPDEGTPVGTPDVPTEDPGVPVPEEPIPSGVPPVTPDAPQVDVPDNSVPQGTPPVVPGTVVPGVVVPEGEQPPTLPQTGEESKLPYVLAGAGLIAFGFWLRRRATLKNH
ncbi:collagen binding domain-containing protein [Saccharibacillus sacchari]|uniref:Collagen binding domain-containing protein n=1 Tax=Saccharibacillus sacchari TaxID=456493 RepID=A0ACC6P9Q0_9BACL